MTVLTETAHAAEFILSEANGQRSREEATVASGQNLDAGEVVMLNGSSKLVAFDAGTDSVAVGVLIYAANATSADVKHVAYIARDAEVNGNLLTYPTGQLAGTTVDLKAIGIIVRN